MTLAAFRHHPGRTFARALAAMLLVSTTSALAAAVTDGDPGVSQNLLTLPELAATADFIGLVQVKDTDYLRRRDIPVSGSAYLAVLIPYKSDRVEELIEVYEKGLHAFECYFPNPTVFEEGRRFLVFLRRDPDGGDRLRGLPQGCALEVLVGEDNRYAVRLPPTGVNLTPDQLKALQDLAEPIVFGDPHAIVEDEAMPPGQRDAMAAAGQIVPFASESPSRQWKYTRGIPIDRFREMLRLEPDL